MRKAVRYRRGDMIMQTIGLCISCILIFGAVLAIAAAFSLCMIGFGPF